MKDDQVGTDHEAMRQLILRRFEDDALLRQEVEAWLDGVAAPGEHVMCDCEESRLCDWFCEKCKGCGKEGNAGGVGDSDEEGIEIGVVPGKSIVATIWRGKTE